MAFSSNLYRLAIKAAAQPAPKPLSILTTTNPGEQDCSIVIRADQARWIPQKTGHSHYQDIVYSYIWEFLSF